MFKQRGHEVTAFVPQDRTKSGRADDRNVLEQLYNDGVVSYTPFGTHDDNFILQYAKDCDGIVVSNDNYRDIVRKNPALFKTVRWRKLGFTWAKNKLMFPTDPLGRYGPNLDTFLRF